MVFNNDDSQMRFIGFRGRDLIRFAYQMPASRVVGGPSWMDEEILRLVVTLGQAPRADEMPDLVRRVLEERLHLQTHVEQRLFPVLALVRARADGGLGPGLRASTLDCFDVEKWVAAGQPPRPLPPAVPRQPVCGEPRFGGRSHVAITMPEFAETLRPRVAWPGPSLSGLPVVDETRLNGCFDVDFDAFTPATAVMARVPASTALFEPLGFNSLPRALEEQLGLTLDHSQAPFDVVVIDSAERPQP